jgi:hypothetical protein
MRWWVDFSRLSSRQRSIADKIRNNPNQSHWIQGFAGTGKTLILLHIMEQIAATQPGASLCYITYTNTLVALVKTTPGYEKIARQADIQTYHKFLRNNKKYDYVFLDEVQDMEQGMLAQIKSLANHLCIAGDPDQQIYEERINSNELISTLQPKMHELIEVYRLTARLCNVARSIMPESRLAEGLRAATNPNASITLMQAGSIEDEANWVWSEASGRARPGAPSVVLFPINDDIYNFACFIARKLNKPAPPKPDFIKGKRDYGPLNQHLGAMNIPAMYLGGKFGSLPESDHRPIVYLMTYYSAKGLDFKNVFIPFLTADKVLIPQNTQLRNPGLGRRILFVAVTRSRENLFISYSGQSPHPYLSELPVDGVTRASLSSHYVPPSDSGDFF